MQLLRFLASRAIRLFSPRLVLLYVLVLVLAVLAGDHSLIVPGYTSIIDALAKDAKAKPKYCEISQPLELSLRMADFCLGILRASVNRRTGLAHAVRFYELCC